MKPLIASLLIAAALSPAAHAQQVAWTSKSVHLRAGPARDFPVVAILAPRQAVTVYTCVPDYVWCDVAAGPDRGWVYAGNFVYTYDNREVVLPGVAALIGIGSGAFIIVDYWHDDYVDRWWYPQRRRWYRPVPLPPIRTRPPGAMPVPGPQHPARPAPAPRPQPRLPGVHAVPQQQNAQPPARPGPAPQREPQRRTPRSEQQR